MGSDEIVVEAHREKWGGVERKQALQVKLLPYLSLLLLFELSMFLYLIRFDPVLARNIHQLLPKRQAKPDPLSFLNDSTVNDPKLGSKVPAITRAPVNAPPLNGYAKPTVLVFVGQCTGCTLTPLWLWQNLQHRRPDLRVVIVTRDSPTLVKQFLKQTKISLPIVSDTDGSLSRAFNALWSHRACAIDTKGRLVWIQSIWDEHPWLEAEKVFAKRR